jgi:peptidoglycan hydrolase-like protein with peptidoglycan-binding domain
VRHRCRRTAVWAFALSVFVVPASAGAATSSTLRSGSHGTAVKTLQRELKAVGLGVSVDGQYGPGTVTAVKRFQRAANLKLTGIADAVTQSRLRQSLGGKSVRGSSGAYGYGSSARSSHLGDRIPLRKGMSGHDVKILQDFLHRDRIRTSIDGQFGSGTARAVRSWERTSSRVVDGVVDAGDIATLRQQVEGGADPTVAAPPTQPAKLAPGDRAQVGSDGLAIAPASAPQAIKDMIAAGNVIAHKPYRYGGGHGRWNDTGYDCSGSVSYALHGANLLNTQLTSGQFESWGDAGPGQWVTIYANGGHVYMLVAGLRFDTSGLSSDGTRWHTSSRSTSGYVVRHPVGL